VRDGYSEVRAQRAVRCRSELAELWKAASDAPAAAARSDRHELAEIELEHRAQRATEAQHERDERARSEKHKLAAFGAA
jgi:hypothetical protein